MQANPATSATPAPTPQPPAHGPVPAAVAALDLHYTRPVAVLHEIDGDFHTILVVGDPEWAAYEWAAIRDGVVVHHSNCGYGHPLSALRDALIFTIGAPSQALRVVSPGQVQ